MNGDDRLGKRTLSLTVLVALCGIIGVYGYLDKGQTRESGRYFWTSTGGAVMFEHETHSAMVTNCADCHHDILMAELAFLCGDCHDDGYVADDFSHPDLVVAHDNECTRCHRTNQAAPKKSCRVCHPSIQESEPGVIACVKCHDGDYDADTMGHDELTAIENHTCNSCHVPRSVSDVYHDQCNRCHRQHDRTRFVDAEGNARCNVCHLK